MLHAPDGLRLTPSYDLVSAALYPEYSTLALSVAGAADLTLDRLRPKHLLTLGKVAGLSNEVIADAVEDLCRRRQALEKAVIAAGRKVDAEQLATDLLELMERRWNGTFASTGRYLSTKRSDGATE